ncbi:hypothetical protein ACFYWX_42500 [Streptomyces sp. NPDC002888]|uniref:hypothetical protein n=1 Tax=Streptomyces sp. NPDC002888 TaxID=3364668 RepID=UPI003676799A
MNDTGPDRTDENRTDDNRTDENRTGGDRTEQELREALEALAGGVRAAPDAYRTARGEWLRRERRRRLVLAVLITVVFALATLIGLWVLNQTPSDPGVIFSGAGGAPSHASLARPHP